MSLRPITFTLGAAAAGLVAGFLAVTTSVIADADPGDITTEVLGTSPFTDTITSDPDFQAWNSFFSAPGFDNEFYFDPHTHIFGDLLTIPGVMQDFLVIEPEYPGEPDGFAIAPLLNPADFFTPDFLLTHFGI